MVACSEYTYDVQLDPLGAIDLVREFDIESKLSDGILLAFGNKRQR